MCQAPFFWWIFPAIFITIFFACFAFRPWVHRGYSPNAPNAEELARQRYAKGEIDAEAFEKILAALRKRG